MSKIIGTVKSISGKANITTGAKQVHPLKIGEALHENDIIQTLQANAKVVLTLEGGREITLDGNDQILLDESVFAVLEEGEVINGKALHQLIADKLGNPEETAAREINTSEANAGAEYASRNDARGTADSSGAFSDDGSSSLSVNFNAIQNENFAPEAFDDTANAIEEGQGSDDQYNAPVVATGNVLANDTDDLLPNPPADLDVTAVTSNDSENPTDFAEGIFTVQGLYGTLELNAETGEYTYTVYEENKSVNGLNIGDSLSESFGYVVSDGGLDDSAILTITINGSNDAPVATGEGSYNSLNTIADEPTEGSAVKFIVETQAGETVTFNWEFSTEDYLPYNDFAFVGIDSSDLILLSDVVTVGNGGSSGIQTYSITFSEAGTHAITFGISDYGDTGVDSWLNVSYLSGGNLLNTKTLGEASEEDSAYTLTSTGATLSELDSFIGNSTGINGLINSFEGNESDSTILAEGNVLSNDTDVDNSHEQLSVISVNGESVPQSEGILTYQGMYGILEMDAKGNFTYTPYDAESETKGAAAVDALNIGDILQESFTYIISDNEEGGAKTDSAVLTVTINGTNDAPVATAEIGSSTEGNEINAAIAATGNVLTNATDVDNAELSVVSVNDQEVSEEGLRIEGTYGLLVINANGSYTYTPYAPESGYENAANTDALSAGEQQHDIFTYTISDNEPGVEKFATGTLDITITGTNDQPIVSNVSGTATETDGTQTFNGQLTLIDPDAGDTHTFEQTGTATVVASNEVVEVTNFSVAVDPDGGYRVNGNFDALAAGETATVTFTYTATDDSGTDNATSDAKTVTLTVTGTNDQPVVSDVNVNGAGITGEVTYTNDTDYSVYDYHTTLSTIEITDSGSIQDLNVQINLTHSWDGDLNIRLIAPDGRVIGLSSYNGGSGNNYTNTVFDDEAITAITSGSAPFNGIYRPEELLSTIDGLEMKGTWTLQISDDAGADSGALYSWSLIIDADSQTYIYESNGVDTIYTGTLTDVTDLDTTDTHTFQLFGTATVETESGAVITDLGVTVAPNGAFTVNGNFDALAEGETATVTFQYVANDGKGFDGTDGVNESSISEPKTVTLTVTGTNDLPLVAASDVSGTVIEIVTPVGDLTDSGTITFSDVDLTDVHSISVITPSADALGTLTATVTADTTGTGLGGIVTWNYAVAASALEYLAENQTKVESFTFNLSDGNGGIVSRTVDVTITGTNDVPVISNTSVITGEAKEASTLGDESIVAGTVASGTLVSTDVDHGATTTWSGDASGTYGSFAINPSTGVWTYTIDDAIGSAADKLSEGQTKTETFTATVTDDKGATATQVVTITITGTNDAPVAFADNGSVTETGSGSILKGEFDLGTLLVSGKVLDNDTDIDNTPTALDIKTITSDLTGQTDSTANLLGNLTINGAYGSLSINQASGAYIYTLNNSNLTVNGLHEGEALTDTFTYSVTDKQAGNPLTDTAVLTITITGTNDAPVITGGNYKGTATEAGNLDDGTIVPATVATGTINASDVDHDTTLTWSGNANGTYGNFAIDPASGVWTYTVDATSGSAADKLAEGQTRTEIFTVTVSDNDLTNPKTDSHIVTIKITGTNDAPTVESTISEQTHVENTSFTIDLNAAFSDMETTDSNLSYSALGNSNLNVTIANGIATITPTSEWNGSETITFTATDKSNASVSQSVLFHVTDTSEVYAYDNENSAVKTSSVIKMMEGFTLDDSDETSTISTSGIKSSDPFVTTGTNNTISFRVDLINNKTTGDSFSWELKNETSGLTVASGTPTESGTVLIPSFDAGTYRLYFSANDYGNSNANQNSGHNTFTVNVTAINLIAAVALAATGNVLTDPNTLISSGDAWGATDDKGIEGAVLSIFDGSNYIAANLSGTSVTGNHGTLVIHSDGSYIYTPNATSTVGQQDTFTYMLTQPDGDSDTAHLVINISDTAYTAATPIMGSGVLNGTMNADVILGSDGDDTLYGNAGNDHLEGGAGSDSLLGGEGNDILMIDSNDTIIDGDAGFDTVILSEYQHLDFSNLGNLQISNIEVLDLTHGDHTLNNIHVADIFNITGESHTLQITGESGDHVGLIQSDWNTGGTTEIAGVGYTVYSGVSEGVSVTLQIQDGIDIQIIP